MSRRKNIHYDSLSTMLDAYAAKASLDYHRYSKYHMRLMDGGFTVLDVWTTGRYYILTTDYLEMIGEGIVERGGEKGDIPTNKGQLIEWLNKLFFPEEIV